MNQITTYSMWQSFLNSRRKFQWRYLRIGPTRDFDPIRAMKTTYAAYLISWRSKVIAKKVVIGTILSIQDLEPDPLNADSLGGALTHNDLEPGMGIEIRRLLEGENQLTRELGLRSTFQEPGEIAKSMNTQAYKVYRALGKLAKKAETLEINFNYFQASCKKMAPSGYHYTRTVVVGYPSLPHQPAFQQEQL